MQPNSKYYFYDLFNQTVSLRNISKAPTIMRKIKIDPKRLSLGKEKITSLEAGMLTGGGDTNIPQPPSGNIASICLCPGASEKTRCGCPAEPRPPKQTEFYIVGTACAVEG